MEICSSSLKNIKSLNKKTYKITLVVCELPFNVNVWNINNVCILVESVDDTYPVECKISKEDLVSYTNQEIELKVQEIVITSLVKCSRDTNGVYNK